MPTPPFDRSEGRALFERTADFYAAARPPYPERVYEVLVERCGLGPGTRALDVGAGSGQATIGLLEAGATVLGVALSSALAEELRRRLVGAAGCGDERLRGPVGARPMN